MLRPGGFVARTSNNKSVGVRLPGGLLKKKNKNMTLTTFFIVVGIIGLVAFIGTILYYHKQEVMLQ